MFRARKSRHIPAKEAAPPPNSQDGALFDPAALLPNLMLPPDIGKVELGLPHRRPAMGPTSVAERTSMRNKRTRAHNTEEAPQGDYKRKRDT